MCYYLKAKLCCGLELKPSTRTSGNWGAWYLCPLRSTVPCTPALRGGGEPGSPRALTRACQPQRGFVCTTNSLSSSVQSDLGLLREKSGFLCDVAGSASRSARAKCQALCSSRLQHVPCFQAAPRGAAERRQDCRVQLSSLPSSATHLLCGASDPFSPRFGTTSMETW